MDKIWLKQYDPGVPTEISLDKYKSLVDYLNQNLKKYASREAFVNLGHSMTYADIDKKSEEFAAYLQTELGLKKGDRFAIMLPNLFQYIIAMFAALRAGLVVVNVNPLYTARELTHQLKDSGSRALFILENFASVAQEALKEVNVEHVIITQIGDGFPCLKAKLINFAVKHVKKMVPKWDIAGVHHYPAAMKIAKNCVFKPVELTVNDMAYLQYTGGTTGVSKGAVLTHGNMLSNVLQLLGWFLPYANPAKQEVVVTALPLYHIFSLTVNCWLFLDTGAKNYLISNPRDIGHFIKEIKDIKFTTTTGVNTLFSALNNHPDFVKVDFSELKYVISGGMALQGAVALRWKEITGVNIVEGYGLTEASPVVSCTPLRNEHFTGSIGLPVPSTDVAIMDDDGNILPFGKEGELCVRGPQVMAGYWQNQEATDNVMFHGEWLRTGDVARIDDKGFVYIVDRKKNMIVISGFNVYPNEIEEVVSQMPQVAEVAAIGVADEKTGERIKLFVVKKDDALTKEEIVNFCYSKLTRYKVPKDVEFMKELPKSNVGKILHRALRDQELKNRQYAKETTE